MGNIDAYNLLKGLGYSMNRVSDMFGKYPGPMNCMYMLLPDMRYMFWVFPKKTERDKGGPVKMFTIYTDSGHRITEMHNDFKRGTIEEQLKVLKKKSV